MLKVLPQYKSAGAWRVFLFERCSGLDCTPLAGLSPEPPLLTPQSFPLLQTSSAAATPPFVRRPLYKTHRPLPAATAAAGMLAALAPCQR